jgi:hypothetical protein
VKSCKETAWYHPENHGTYMYLLCGTPTYQAYCGMVRTHRPCLEVYTIGIAWITGLSIVLHAVRRRVSRVNVRMGARCSHLSGPRHACRRI